MQSRFRLTRLRGFCHCLDSSSRGVLLCVFLKLRTLRVTANRAVPPMPFDAYHRLRALLNPSHSSHPRMCPCWRSAARWRVPIAEDGLQVCPKNQSGDHPLIAAETGVP